MNPQTLLSPKAAVGQDWEPAVDALNEAAPWHLKERGPFRVEGSGNTMVQQAQPWQGLKQLPAKEIIDTS